jgi:hypothetical protein
MRQPTAVALMQSSLSFAGRDFDIATQELDRVDAAACPLSEQTPHIEIGTPTNDLQLTYPTGGIMDRT